jgi:hypothetical protein
MNDIQMNSAEAKKQILKGLLYIIDKVPDDDSQQAKNALVTYLNGLLRTRGIVPPSSEIITLIKHQKPKLYHSTRLHLSPQSHLQILFQISMDPSLAATRFQEFIKSK